MQLARQSTGGGQFRISDPQRTGRQSISRPSSDPSLVLDLQFQRDAAFVSRRGPLPTFTRASQAWYVNSSGIIVPAAINEPRIDYDPTTLACLGLLLEESRTNLCIHSENLSAANWGKSNVSVTTDSSTAPTGLLTADLLAETAVSGFHTISIPSVTPAAGTTYSISAFFKKGPGATAPDWLILGLSNQFPASVVAFNVTTGAFGAVTGSSFTYRAIAYPNGWWRVVIVVTASGSSVTPPLTVYFSNNANTVSAPSYLGQTTSNVLVWGAQVEAGAFPTSYIPTGAAAVVRSADVCSITGTDFTSFWNQTEGTIVLGYDRNHTADVTVQATDDGTVNERLINAFASGAERQGVVDGATVNNLDRTGGSVNTLIKHAGRYKNLDFAFSANGSAVTTSVAQTVPTVTQMTLGSRLGAAFLCGHIRFLQVYSRTKTNAQLQTLSTP